MIPYGRQWIDEADIRAGVDILRSDWLTQGPVQRLLAAHVEGREDFSRQLWGLLTFTSWFDLYARAPAAV